MEKKLLSILICILAAVIAVPTSAIDMQLFNENYRTIECNKEVDWWSMFQHDLNHSGFSSSSAPDSNNKIWSYEIGEDIRFSSPAVIDEKLYIGTGEIWDTRDNALDNYYSVDVGLYSLYQPLSSLIDRNLASSYSENGSIYCLDAKLGSKIWSFPTNGSVYSSPAVADGKVYAISADSDSWWGEIYCLDASSGAKIWNTTVNSGFTSPVVDNGYLYTVVVDPIGTEGKLLCLDASNGDEIWNYSLESYELAYYSVPAIADGRIYITSVAGVICRLHCVDLSSGEGVWVSNLSSMEFGFALSSPVIDGEYVYVVSGVTKYSDFLCKLSCLYIVNGSTKWEYPMQDPINELSFSTPAVANGKIYVSSTGEGWSFGSIRCFNAENGSIIWNQTSTTDFYTMSSPAVADDKVYIGGFSSEDLNALIYCYGASDGDLLWTSGVEEFSFTDSSLAIADECVYIAATYGTVCSYQDELEIGEISRGIASIKAEIKNVGDRDLNNVYWRITVTGGLLKLINHSDNDVIEILKAQTTEEVKAIPIIGFGRIYVKVSTVVEGIDALVEERYGIIFGIFILLLGST